MTVKKTLEFLRRESDETEEHTIDPGAHALIRGATHEGMVRERNEDQYVIARLERTLHIESCGLKGNDGRDHTDVPTGRLMMVADGMGGQTAGDVASAVVVDAMLSYAFTLMPWLRLNSAADERALAEGLTSAVERAQERMHEVAERKGFSTPMGSTLTMGYVMWPMLYLVHVGDSRAYLFRGGELFRLTRDHNLAHEMVQMKVMTEAEAAASRFSSVLTNCVSTGNEELKVELHQIELRRKDIVLLCTDGLYGEVPDSAIKSRLSHVSSPELVGPCVISLIESAKKAGGRDNITGVLAHF